MKVPDFKQLQADIKGREFVLAKQIFGLTDGNDSEYRQVCPLCGAADSFYFRSPKFCCTLCNFTGELIQLVHKVRQVSHNAAYDIIVKTAAETAVFTMPLPEQIIPAHSVAVIPEPTAANAYSTRLALNSHPLADMFPMLPDAEQKELTADIGKHGQLEPIWRYEGKILDGRNRYKSCEELGIDPIIKEYDGNNPAAFVISKNVKRRHLSESQRAMLAVELEQFGHGGARIHQDAIGHLGTRAELAASLEISPRSVARAKKVKKSGTPEDVQAVRDGKLSVSVAEKKIQSDSGENEQVSENTVPVQDVPYIAPLNTSKTLPNSADRLPDDLKTALQLPMDSRGRADALTSIFKTIIADCFEDSNNRRDFLQGLLSEFAEYGV